MTGSPVARTHETAHFDGLAIRFDDRVLRPRGWTAAQSRWAASLLASLPPGDVLELCSGAGQIGLAAVARSRRRLACVDGDPVAASYAMANARANGMADRVEVRAAAMAEALSSGEEFVLVIADPPWVRRRDVRRYPKDPVTAIDGGPDGLDLARQCVAVIGAHLSPGGTALVQLGSPEQVDALASEVADAGLHPTEIRCYDGGVVARLDRSGARDG
jgi:release factor glutamine methyltransferase